MGNENQLYSISLGVASLQGGLVGVATALSPATCRPFQVFSPSFFVGLELAVEKILHLHRDCQEYGPSKTEEIYIAKSEFGDNGGSGHTSSKKLDAPRNVVGEVKYLHKR